ncbi:unnamed protein product [Onchocerca flexuosa]|uniref:Uncharacterized protein n=1 Tax=Onchocerca flexuosa TaxID=387005 RepID=A0A183HHP6_9BILA|nr:unnamed protein product [Onchocerca flexuosa]
MYLLRCCGLCDQPIETNPTLENQPEILDEPVIIESLPDVATLQLAQPSELSEKLALPSVPAIVPIPIPTHWEVSKKTSPMKVISSHHNAMDKTIIGKLIPSLFIYIFRFFCLESSPFPEHLLCAKFFLLK